MKSRALLDPIAMLDEHERVIEKKYVFAAKTPDAVRSWQKRARAAMAKCLGMGELKAGKGAPRILDEVDRGSYVQRKVLLSSTQHSAVPVYVLLPKAKVPQRRPCVLALHGHGYGARSIVGISEEGQHRNTPGGYQRDFAVALVRRGFVVAAPEICCFGEREGSYGHLGDSPRPSSCHNASTYAMMLGLNIAGIRVWDGMRVVDYLRDHVEQADVSRLGVMGISGGGMHAFFSACLDLRIKATVISGYFCDWRQSILAINHCTCNFVPGLMRLGELSDFAGLIAPRPLLVENGTQDTIFPIKSVRATVRRAQEAWRVAGAEQRIAEDYFEDGHRINGKKAYPFLEKHLGLKL